MRIHQPGKAIPWLYFVGISAMLVIIANTSIFEPIMQFIQTEQVSNWQIIACIIFSVAGFKLSFVLLNVIGRYYSSKFEAADGDSADNVHQEKLNNGEMNR